MTNEDAIKWLENLKQDIGQLRYENLWPYAQAIDEIIDMLDEQDASGWVSVKDRLPEDGQEVVAAEINGFNEVMTYHTEKDGVWDGEQGWCSTDKINYWLPLPPLPEPPKEETP